MEKCEEEENKYQVVEEIEGRVIVKAVDIHQAFQIIDENKDRDAQLYLESDEEGQNVGLRVELEKCKEIEEEQLREELERFGKIESFENMIVQYYSRGLALIA